MVNVYKGALDMLEPLFSRERIKLHKFNKIDKPKFDSKILTKSWAYYNFICSLYYCTSVTGAQKVKGEKK